MKLAHEFGGFDVDRVLIAKGALLHAQDEGEILNVVGKLMEHEPNMLVLVEIVEFEVLKVAYKDVAGKLVFLESGKIIEGLLLGPNQISSGAFLFDEKHALPKQIEKATLLSEQPYRLFEARNPSPAHTKDFKEFVIESLALASFVMRILPVFGEAGGANSDFVPAKVHVGPF